MTKEIEKVISIDTIKKYIKKNNQAKEIANYNTEMRGTARHLYGNFDLTIESEIESDSGKTPLHVAAQNNNLYLITYFISEEEGINAQDKFGWTPLHYAVHSGDVDTVKLLIDKGADLSIVDHYEKGTPVFYAFQYGYLELVKYFVEEMSIDPLMKINEYGCTLFDEAIVGGDSLDTIKYLIDERNVIYDGNDLLERAVSNGHLETIKYLIEEKGVDPNFASENGWSPLFEAVADGHVEITKYLLEKKANIHATFKDGSTVLHVAAHDCKFEIVQHLIEKGADVNARDNKGNTPLHVVAEGHEFQNKRHQQDVAKYLVNCGADVSTKNTDCY